MKVIDIYDEVKSKYFKYVVMIKVDEVAVLPSYVGNFKWENCYNLLKIFR